MTTENDSEDPNYRIEATKHHVKWLQGRLHSEKNLSEHYRNEAMRWKKMSELEQGGRVAAQNDLRVLRKDIRSLSKSGDAAFVYLELEEKRAELVSLRRATNRRRALTRTAVERLVAVRQEKRDADEVIEQLSSKVTELKSQLEGTAAQAQAVIDQRDAKLARIKGWCDRWIKGEVGGREVLAALVVELNSNLALDPTILERRRAVESMQTLALLAQYQENDGG